MQKIQKIRQYVIKHTYAAIAAELLLAIVMSAIPLGSVAAAGQLSSRNIQMSDSGASGGTIASGVGSGLFVDYKVAFTVATSAATIGGIVIDFCSDSPLVFNTCTAPTGFNTNYATTQIYNQTNLGTGAFSVYTGGTAQSANRIVITRATPTAMSGASSFELGNGTANGFTNPSANGTFYARIITYDTAAHAQSHVIATSDNFYVDYGGIALSIANVITITARVQENIIFCASGAAPTANCGGTTVPAITLGHGTTGKVIDSSVIDTGNVYTQLSTNAGAGAIIRMHNSNSTCGGLSSDSGTTCGIPPVNSGTASAGVITAGSAAFGLTVAAGSGGTGSVSPVAPYSNVAANTYGMDSTTASDNVTTSFGDSVASCATPVSNVNNTWTFAATASNITPAGLYSANIAVIATGTF